MGTPFSVRIIEDVDMALKALEIVYCANGASFEGLSDINGPIFKEVGEGKLSVGSIDRLINALIDGLID